MRFNYFLFVGIFSLIGCSPPKVLIIQPRFVLGVKIMPAQPYTNYSISEINTNIDKSTTIINQLDAKIKELEDKTPSKNNIEKIEQYKKDKGFIEDDVTRSWENSQFVSKEFRKENNELPEKKQYLASDFTNFLDIDKGKLIGEVIGIFGKPDLIKKNYIGYQKDKKIILKAHFDSRNRVVELELFGREGYQLAKRKDVKDKSFYFLGMHDAEIENYFKEELYSGASSDTYSIGSTYTDGVRIEFTCPKNKNVVCDAISVKWE